MLAFLLTRGGFYHRPCAVAVFRHWNGFGLKYRSAHLAFDMAFAGIDACCLFIHNPVAFRMTQSVHIIVFIIIAAVYAVIIGISLLCACGRYNLLIVIVTGSLGFVVGIGVSAPLAGVNGIASFRTGGRYDLVFVRVIGFFDLLIITVAAYYAFIVHQSFLLAGGFL